MLLLASVLSVLLLVESVLLLVEGSTIAGSMENYCL